MTLHLELQEICLGPSDEWMPDDKGWMLMRVVEGTGYCLRKGAADELVAGDGIVSGLGFQTQIRASLLGPMKVQYFTVEPEYLGLLTMEEWFKFKALFRSASPRFRLFRSSDAIGQKFTEIVKQSQGNPLSTRCALLQLWAEIVGPWVRLDPGKIRSRSRFQQTLLQMSVMELSARSRSELVQMLKCSTRHFQRLFRKEFGLPLRMHLTDMRLLQAKRLLIESDALVKHIAGQCGYRHLGLFNKMFRQRFGMSPGEWRRQARKMPA